ELAENRRPLARPDVNGLGQEGFKVGEPFYDLRDARCVPGLAQLLPRQIPFSAFGKPKSVVSPYCRDADHLQRPECAPLRRL
nr:hypothetical protein [Tanacetum cinerariifolium]